MARLPFPLHRSLQSSFAHTKEEAEQTASDADGSQGGQRWSPPTYSPTMMPTDVPSESPTLSPTYHPTPHGEPFVLKGTIWYDRNANSRRDAGLAAGGMGEDVEWGWGLGGVRVSLVECDPETNRDIPSETPMASTVSTGYNSKMEPMLSSGGGVYRLVNIRVDRSYAVQVEAPDGYLFTHGICNDDERGWKCRYSRVAGARRLQGPTQRGFLEEYRETERGDAGVVRTWFSRRLGERRLAKDYAAGISSGRSSECISIDRFGVPDRPLDFGVLRIGDAKAASADVALRFDFDDAAASETHFRSRNLKRMISDALALPPLERDGVVVVRRYLLAERDKNAIGSVTAQVLASRLDARLAEHQIVLDAVEPKNVIVSTRADDERSSNEVAVALRIQGHYSPPPELDFEYIVNDSINSDSDEIRRNLREYNRNCRDQAAAMPTESWMGDDVHVVPGSSSTRGGGGADAYTSVCAEGQTLPTIFETSLKEVQVTRVSDMAFGSILYTEEEGRLESWAMGPLATVTGLIALLMGAFVFRRAWGPRKADRYREATKTRDVDGCERRRFGEMGGDVDDGSVDSAFYSEDDEDDFKEGKEKEKERRRRRKLKEASKKAGKGVGVSSRKFGKSTRKLVALAKSSRTLTVKSGSVDETDSVPSGDSPKDAPDETKRRKTKSDTDTRDSAKTSSPPRNSTRRNSMHSSTTSARQLSVHSSMTSIKSEHFRSSATSNKSKDSTKKSRSRRGRDQREGGDNARIVHSERRRSIN